MLDAWRHVTAAAVLVHMRCVVGDSLMAVRVSCARRTCCASRRGFHVCYIREDSAVPERVDPQTGAVSTILKPCHKFRISFDARGPRDDIKVSLGVYSGTFLGFGWAMDRCVRGLRVAFV